MLLLLLFQLDVFFLLFNCFLFFKYIYISFRYQNKCIQSHTLKAYLFSAVDLFWQLIRPQFDDIFFSVNNNKRKNKITKSRLLMRSRNPVGQKLIIPPRLPLGST